MQQQVGVLLAEVQLSRLHRIDGFEQIGVGGALVDVGGGARLHGLFDVVLVLVHGQHDHFGARPAALDLPQAIQPVHLRHGQVEQQQVRLQLLKQLESLFAVSRFAYHRKVRVALQQQFQAGAEEFVVIRQ